MSREVLALGDEHWLSWLRWAPDRALNPKWAHLPDVDKYGAIVSHTKPDGTYCEGLITFAGQVQAEVDPKATTWQVHSWSPLTLSPSLLCGCGDHGFIREGKWVRA